MPIDESKIKQRISNLFTYLKELKKRLDEIIVDQSKYDWILRIADLPLHPCVQVNLNEDKILLIRRPKEVKCPEPSDELKQWLKGGWQKIKNEAIVLESKNIEDDEGKTKTIFFKDYPEIINEFEQWNIKRSMWQKAELPSEEVRNVFSKLHELKGRIDKESEKIDFFITNGVLSTESTNGRINHPLILQSVSLVFDPSKDEPEFSIERTEKDPFMYVEALRRAEVNGHHLIKKKEEFETTPHFPDGDSDIKGFLKSLVHFLWQDGEYLEDKELAIKSEKTSILYEISFILGKRNDNFYDQIDEYLKKIGSLDVVPIAFKNIVGAFDDDPPPLDGIENGTTISGKLTKAKTNYYLTKEYNHEQKRIIDALNSSGCVSVQGPPGTGKSHTIANLIGHLLAEGKRVLVSSYTTKALNVIREKVVSELRPLCVSVLDQDAESKRQLQESVSFINSIVLNSNLDTLENEINIQEKKKYDIENRINELKNEYVNAVYSEYRPISFLGKSFLPKDAAKIIVRQKEKLFNGVFLTDVPPLSNSEYEEVIHLMDVVSEEDYEILCEKHPSTSELISPEEFNKYLEFKRLNIDKVSKVNYRLQSSLATCPSNKVTHIQEVASNLFRQISELNIAELRILNVCLRGNEYRNYIEETYERLMAAIERIEKSKPILFKYDPRLDVDHDIDELISVLRNVSSTTEEKSGFSMFRKLFSKEIRLIEEHARVKNRKPNTGEEYLSLVHLLSIKKERLEIKESFRYEIISKYQLDFDIHDDEPEIHVCEFLKSIKRIFEIESEIRSFVSLLEEFCIPWPSIESDSLKIQMAPDVREIEVLKYDLETYLLPALEAFIEKHEVDDLNNRLELNILFLKKYNNVLSKKLLETLQNCCGDDFENHYSELQRLNTLVLKHDRLQTLLNKVMCANQNLWRLCIERAILGYEVLNFEDYWRASYLAAKLDEYNSIDTNEIKEKIDELQLSLKKLSSTLIKNKTIYGQLKRTKQEHRQALINWVQLQNSMTKNGKGKLDNFKRKEAKELIKKAQNAVPVWIMPLARVLDNFKLTDDSFDVLIIDEASQADLTYLPILAIANKVIVVGDDKQVSPAVAGKSFDGLENLILEFLGEIPGRANFNYKYSLFDIACASFGEKIPLKEHFRCVPAIIQFCNELSYDGAIKVLREELSSDLQPPLIPFYVPDANSDSAINEKEARYIVSSILAMIDTPAYFDKSFGVISLKGPKQHLYIDQMLREKLTSKQFEKHRILCGKAPQFQGDERDVIFLSLVDAPTSPQDVLTKISDTEDRKKEFNVAVSRARDQLWIFHSMHPDSQLKPDDLRLRLLRHAKDPRSLIEKHSINLKLAESPFEKAMHEDLIRGGYQFIPQYEVGAYRIDIVLLGPDGCRIALECDGEKYHSTEEQVRNDLDRQSVLERLGFKFIRVRGSDYYRNKEQTIIRLFSELSKFGITPVYNQEEKSSIAIEPPYELMEKIQKIFAELSIENEENQQDRKIG